MQEGLGRFWKALQGARSFPALQERFGRVRGKFLTGSGHSSGKVPGELLYHSALTVQNIGEFSFFVLGYLYFGRRYEL